MKIKNGFILREISGVNVVIGVGANAEKIKNSMVKLNESGAFIWKVLEKGATVDEVVSAVLNEYDAPEEVIRLDVENIIKTLKEIGAIDD